MAGYVKAWIGRARERDSWSAERGRARKAKPGGEQQADVDDDNDVLTKPIQLSARPTTLLAFSSLISDAIRR